ncbi:MAG: hypothetical protein WC802_00115 [Patescibacteria group bacterium]|jgi:hypothetical protein
MAGMPTGHKNGTHAIIISMLVALLALETVTLGFVVMKVGAPSLAPTIGAKVQTPPIAYIEKSTPSSPYGSKILVLDPKTGKESTLVDLGSASVASTLIVPQRGYDGRIFADIAGEGGEDLYFNLSAFDLVNGGDPRQPLETFDSVIYQQAVRVSPDQTKIAYIPYSQDAKPGNAPSNTLEVLDLLTGEKTVIGLLSENLTPGTIEGYSFALPTTSSNGSFGTAKGFDFTWKNDSCVIATVYRTPLESDIATETFCIK